MGQSQLRRQSIPGPTGQDKRIFVADILAGFALASLCAFGAALPVSAAQAPSPVSNPPANALPRDTDKAAVTTMPPDSSATPAGYHIGAGDVLAINVWKEPEVSVQNVVVRPDGKVTLPLLKEVNVLGLTPTELEKVLTGKLERYIHGADVTVVVKEIHSKRVYLVGAVKKEGTIPLLSDMTVLQVLSEAGGLTDYAKRKKIYVLRTDNGKREKHPFDYDAVIKGEHMEENIQVLPDDTIVVPH
ncbi:MAG TPA: polysaccharide biosynthesis/export family protein [Bryobacteraceae bacterium]|nr:polysaccharide biosynthesis/export family protein [Bryobacteraceae bacterium]